MDLETVNAGFARAMDGDECQLAYCQSELYVEYMLALGGSEAPKKMVAAYAEDPSTEAAIRKVFGISQAEFERGYRAFLRKQIDATPVLAAAESERFDELEKAHRKRAEGRAGRGPAGLGLFPAGREEGSRGVDRRGPQASAQAAVGDVRSRALQKAGTPQEAMAKLESCLDRKAPEPLVLNLLASMKLKAEKYDEAAELYALGERLDPANPQWTAGRARVYLAADQKQNLARALVRFAQIEPADLPSRKKLAELALERREAAVARRWATEALEIQVEDADAHRLLAAALVELNELDRAIEEFEAAIETQSGQSSAALRPGRRPASGPAAGQGEKGPGRIAPPRPQIPRGRHPAGKPREETLE